MAETVDDYTPGRSLMAEMTELKEQMKALKAAMLQLVDLQREANTTFDTVLNFRNIGDGATDTEVQSGTQN
jgi:hypothetical protein